MNFVVYLLFVQYNIIGTNGKGGRLYRISCVGVFRFMLILYFGIKALEMLPFIKYLACVVLTLGLLLTIKK